MIIARMLAVYPSETAKMVPVDIREIAGMIQKTTRMIF